MRYTILILAACLLAPAAAGAQEPMTGIFHAEATCVATPSLRNPDDNPGNIRTQSGRSYTLLGRNAVPGSHYLIRVPGAEPERRWVAYGCGRIDEPSQSAQVATDWILAASWPSAFCEDVPQARECARGDTPLAFTLHGLWPQTPDRAAYCGVAGGARAADAAGGWRRLPPVTLSGSVETALARVMPGTQSALDRHQWLKHGTCSGLDADAYFAAAVRLVDLLNDSPVRALFADHAGQELSGAAIRRTFDAAFGPGAGDRVLVDCVEVSGRRLIRELRIALGGQVEGRSLAALVAEGERQPRGCRTGEVDLPG